MQKPENVRSPRRPGEEAWPGAWGEARSVPRPPLRAAGSTGITPVLGGQAAPGTHPLGVQGRAAALLPFRDAEASRAGTPTGLSPGTPLPPSGKRQEGAPASPNPGLLFLSADGKTGPEHVLCKQSRRHGTASPSQGPEVQRRWLCLWPGPSLAQPTAEHSRGWVRRHRRKGDQPGERRGRQWAACPHTLALPLSPPRSTSYPGSRGRVGARIAQPDGRAGDSRPHCPTLGW